MKKSLVMIIMMMLVVTLMSCSQPDNLGTIYDLVRRDLEGMSVLALDTTKELKSEMKMSNTVEDALGFIMTIDPDEDTELTEENINRNEDLMYDLEIRFVDKTYFIEVGTHFIIFYDDHKEMLGLHFISTEIIDKLEGYMDRVINY